MIGYSIAYSEWRCNYEGVNFCDAKAPPRVKQKGF